MQRKLITDMKRWKDSANRKPLILLGARQVGKTWLMQEFGRRFYDSVAYVNCDAEPLAKRLFADDYDINRILFSIQTITGVKPLPGSTLIIFDELQEAPRGLHSLKYFLENAPQYHVVAAGSLLGVTLGTGESFPVGKVDMMRVCPMDFEEFLEANDAGNLVEVLRRGDWSMIDMFSSKFREQLLQYYFVGGMPEVVSHFVADHDQREVRRYQENILEVYRNDVSKHSSKSESIRIGQVMESLPLQLAKENKKFIYGAMRPGARAREYEVAIQWLVDAGIAVKVPRVNDLRMPLKFYKDAASFKLFLLDCGLLGCMAGASPKQMLADDSVFIEFKGAFTEQFVLQQLVAGGRQSYYWSSATTPAEIDFVVETDERVIPIEVKAGENVRSRSMKTYIDSHPTDHLKGLRISMRGYVDQGWMENIPLYGISHFQELFSSGDD